MLVWNSREWFCTCGCDFGNSERGFETPGSGFGTPDSAVGTLRVVCNSRRCSWNSRSDFGAPDGGIGTPGVVWNFRGWFWNSRSGVATSEGGCVTPGVVLKLQRVEVSVRCARTVLGNGWTTVYDANIDTLPQQSTITVDVTRNKSGVSSEWTRNGDNTVHTV